MKFVLLAVVALALAAVPRADAGLDCTTYCTLVAQNCNGTNTQWPSTGQCMAACSAWPPGNITDQGQNSLGCRLYHAGAPSAGDPDTHCWHAGSSGGGTCGTVCQALCNYMTADPSVGTNGYCASPNTGLPQTGYGTSNQPKGAIGSYLECSGTGPTSFCGNWLTNAQLPTKTLATSGGIFNANTGLPTAGDTLECRTYHATVAQWLSPTDTATATQHCSHASPLSNSGVCGANVTSNYCDLQIHACGLTSTPAAAATASWSSQQQCEIIARLFNRSTTFDDQGLGPLDGNNLECRFYHAGVANSGLTGLQATHCLHSGAIGLTSCGSSACESYCYLINQICTGSLAQYASIAACMATCPNIHVNSPGVYQLPYATAGSSLECRLYHVQAAVFDATTHCPHAGPSGGPDTCGSMCDAYCDQVLGTCGSTNDLTSTMAQYPDVATCLKTCSAFPVGTFMDTASSSTACRLYHAGAAAINAAPGTVEHCWHAGPSGGNTCGTECQAYCQIELAACGFYGVNATGQYPDMASCLLACGLMNSTVPTVYVGGSLSSNAAGNTLDCRTYHSTVALQSSANAQLHCPHSGPTGGQVCGSFCDAFAQMVQGACTGTLQQYPTAAEAVASCIKFATDGQIGDQSGNTVQCRMYHAGVALYGGLTTEQIHCPHTAPVSAVCTGPPPGSTGLHGGAASVAASAAVVVGAAAAAVIAAL